MTVEAMFNGYYDLAFRIIQNYRLNATEVYASTVARVAAQSKKLASVNEVLQQIRVSELLIAGISRP